MRTCRAAPKAGLPQPRATHPPSPCSIEAEREVVINLETYALGSADGSVQGFAVDIEVSEGSARCCSLAWPLSTDSSHKAAPCAPCPCLKCGPCTHLRQRVTVDGQRVGDDVEDIVGEDDPREDTLVSCEAACLCSQATSPAPPSRLSTAAWLHHLKPLAGPARRPQPARQPSRHDHTCAPPCRMRTAAASCAGGQERVPTRLT